MDTGGSKGGMKADINVTPLVDIVLVLLIVFIVMVPGLSCRWPSMPRRWSSSRTRARST